jgi:hypothetical protein
MFIGFRLSNVGTAWRTTAATVQQRGCESPGGAEFLPGPVVDHQRTRPLGAIRQ